MWSVHDATDFTMPSAGFRILAVGLLESDGTEHLRRSFAELPRVLFLEADARTGSQRRVVHGASDRYWLVSQTLKAHAWLLSRSVQRYLWRWPMRIST